MTIMDNFIRVLAVSQTAMVPCSGPLHVPAHKQRDPKAAPGQLRVQRPVLTQRWPEPHPIDPVEPDLQDASWT